MGRSSHFLISIILLLFCANCTEKKRIETKPYILPNTIHGKNFAINSKDEVYFSKRNLSNYSIYKYKDGAEVPFKRAPIDILNPFCIGDSVYGNVDGAGDEKFITTNSDLNKKLGSSGLKDLYSSARFQLIVFTEFNEKNLYLYDLQKNNKVKILTFNDKVHSVDFLEGRILVSYDESLVLCEYKKNSIVEIAKGLPGVKLNPFVDKKDIYFVNNSNGEFYNIYKSNLNSPANYVCYFKSNFDLKMPKKHKGILFFLEINKSEYRLTYLDRNYKKRYITTNGVVFNYSFVGNEVLFTYSNVNLPRSLYQFDLQSSRLSICSSDKIQTRFSATFIEKSPNTSFGYKIMLDDTSSKKGVILYLRGGIKETDFSPRWDDVLMNLVNNGYIVYAPNFLTSFGYGKTYTNASYKEAIKDLIDWKKFITNNNPKLKFFLLSSSSGNVFMEDLISLDRSHVSAAASIFGYYTNKRNFNLLPTLFILGKNDPYVNFDLRVTDIRRNSILMYNKEIVVYENEGHWFRSQKNIKDAIDRIITRFN